MNTSEAAIQLSLSQKKQIEDTIRRESPRLLGFIKKYVRRVEDAEDILQDVFYQFIRSFDDIQYIDRSASWLFTTARNRIIDVFRKKKAEPISEINVHSDDGDVLTLEDILPALGTSPEDNAMRKVIMDEIEEALSELPEEQREAFVQNEIEGRSFREISESTGISVNTWLSRKRYAVMYLRSRLEELFKEIL